jgi:hypothetical protein
MKEALSSSETSIHTTANGVTSQKTPFFIVTAVKTSHLTSAFSIRTKNTGMLLRIGTDGELL